MGYRLLLTVLLAAACTACTPKQPQVSPDKASSDEWRLQNIEARFLEFQEQQKAREAELQGKVRELDGRVVSLKQQLQEMEEQTGALQAEAATMKETMRAKEHMAASQASAPAPMKASTPEPASQKTITAPKSAPKPARKPASVVMQSPTHSAEQAMYNKGLALVRGGEVDKGRKLLDKFLGEYPNSQFVPNGLYWLGETYYHEKRYAQAILTFKEVVRRFPQNNKAAAGMLKIGFAYEQLDDISNARFYLQTLVEDYPESGPAGLARKRLANM